MATPLKNMIHSRIGQGKRIRVFLAVEGHDVVDGDLRQVHNANPSLFCHAVKQGINLLLRFDA